MNANNLCYCSDIFFPIALPCIRKQIMPDECSSNQETEPGKLFKINVTQLRLLLAFTCVDIFHY